MRNIFLIIGNFGVGKTAVCKFYPHEKTTEPIWTECEGMLMLGGKLGADSISGMDFKKEFIITKAIPDKKDRDIVIHSVFYSSDIDILRYKKTHNLFVIYLKTSYEENYKRMFSRKGKHLSLDDFERFERGAEKFLFLCKQADVPCKVVDNDRSPEEVSNEVWLYIKDNCSKIKA